MFVLMIRTLALFDRVTYSCSLCKSGLRSVFDLLKLNSSLPSIVHVSGYSQLTSSLVDFILSYTQNLISPLL